LLGENLQVEPFTRFEELIRAACGAAPDWRAPRQVTYLRSYLTGFPNAKAATVVVETGHTDRHYLDEYTAYYATLLAPPAAKTTRLHVFASGFDEDLFVQFIRNAATGKLDQTQRDLSEVYLGYITVRPISSAPIGRTVVRHYGASEGRRYNPAIRGAKARIAGVELSLDALPFFQQDRGVGACATAALWSALASAARSNGMRTPTPYAVTVAATKNLVTDRLLPATSGLELSQLASAMREHGLSPYTVKVGNEPDLFLWTLKTYLQSGVPAVLFLGGENEGHAVVVAGYKETSDASLSLCLPGGGRDVRTSKLTRVYVHDDRIGPYVRMDLGTKTTGKGKDKWRHVTLRRANADDPADEGLTHNMTVRYALYPLYPKLRMTAPELVNLAAQISPIFRQLLGPKVAAKTRIQTWFTQNGDYLRNLYQLQPEPVRLSEFVTRLRLSRYVGIARWYLDDKILADVVCDTTDINREHPRYGAVLGIFFMNAKHAVAGKQYQDMMRDTVFG